MRVINRPWNHRQGHSRTINRPLGRAVRRVIQRYFHQLDAAAGQYYQMSGPITLGSAFEVVVSFYDNGSPDNAAAVSFKNTSTGEFLEMQIDIPASTPLIKVGSNGRTPGNGAALVDGLNTWSIVYNGTTIDSYLNGAFSYSVTPTATSWLNDPFDQVRLGFNQDSTVRLTGGIADLKIWTGGDRDTGTLIVGMPLDTDLSSPVVPNAAAVLGGELVINGSFENGDNWIDYGSTAIEFANGRVEVGGGQVSTVVVDQALTLTAGKQYLVSYDVVELSAGKCSFNVSGSGQEEEPFSSAVGKRTLFFTATGAGSLIQLRFDANFIGAVDDVSIREIPAGYPYATAVNMTTADAKFCTKNTAADPDQWENGDQTFVLPIAGA